MNQAYAATRAENHHLKVRSLPEEPLRNACVGELSVAEMVCIDRCVPKYLDTYRMVSKELAATRKAAEGGARAT